MQPERFRFTEEEKRVIKRALGFAAAKRFFLESDDHLIDQILRKLGCHLGRDDEDYYAAYHEPDLR